MIPVARTEIAPAAGGWNDVNVTALVAAGATAGVFLEFVNTNVASYEIGVRKNGSGDTIVGELPNNAAGWHHFLFIGVDANDIFECYIENAEVKVYITGYIKNSEGSFETNAIDKTASCGVGAYADVDISGDTGGETALCAFFLLDNTVNVVRAWALKEKGSGDDFYLNLNNLCLTGAAMSVDGSEVLEGKIVVNDLKVYLVGWLTDNFTSWANAKNYSTGVIGAYTDVDMSGDIPADNDGAFMHIVGTVGTPTIGLREKGAGYDNYHRGQNHQLTWVEIDANREAEQKIVANWIDLYLWGYTNQPANQPPTAPTSLEVDGKSTPTGADCVTSTPLFTAIFNDPDAGDQSNAIQIQVGTASGLSDLWDSDWIADSTVEGNRCSNKTYAGAVLSAGTSYWWRCRFRDDDNTEGAWSAWQEFLVCVKTLVQAVLI